jgi:copper chaperone CopZ
MRGYILDPSVDLEEAASTMEVHEMLSKRIHGVAFPVLIALTAMIFLTACAEQEVEEKKAVDPEVPPFEEQDLMTVTLTIEGMTCEHCVETVTRVLSKCEGVSTAEVFLEAGEALVKGVNLDKEALTRAVVDAGGGVYKVTKAE